MVKSKKEKSTKKTQGNLFSEFSFSRILSPKYQLVFSLVIILLLFLIFFKPIYFESKVFQSGDIITRKSLDTYLEKYEHKDALWNPYIFGGMPAYAISVSPTKDFNLIWVIIYQTREIFGKFFSVDYAKHSIFLIALAYAMFAFFHFRTKNILLSLLVALAVSFSTGLIVFYFIGHLTKLYSIWVFPILLLILFDFQKRAKPFHNLIHLILLSIILGFLFIGWHVQIIFYVFFSIIIYYVYFYLRALRLGDKLLKVQLMKSVLIFIASIFIGLLIHSDNLTQVFEYTPFSTRGTESIVEKETGKTQQNESEFYQYATNWSFSPGEVLTFIIPSYYGFGKSTYQGPLSQNQPVEVNTYFGQMPFVDVAMYMGVVIFFLAVFSMVVNWKDPIVRYLTVLVTISLLISFGRTFPVLYDLMFYYFPFFDKFRVPSMILVLVQLTIPVLAGLGLVKIIELRKESDLKIEKIVKNFAIVFGILLLIFIIFASPIKEWFIQRIIDAGQKGSQLQPLHNYMSEMFINDARLAFFFSGLTFGLVYAYLKFKLSADLLLLFIIVIVIVDLFRIDKRGETYIDSERIDILFEKPDYLEIVEQLNDKSIYRVLNLKQDGSIGSLNQNSNFLSYFLHYDIYGYSGIKPRAIQDYYDVLGSPANPTFWRMLNVKYLVLDRSINYPGLKLVYNNDKTFLYLNENSLPRAYFVNQVETKQPFEILNSVKGNQFDPKNIAFVENNIESIEKPDESTFVNIKKYADDHITLDVFASGNNFLFLGDTYMTAETDYIFFKMHTGWKAFVDGSETKIYKTNHSFRGIIIPQGKHKVEFIYIPQSFYITKRISLIVSSLVIFGLVVILFLSYRKKRNLMTV